MKKMLVFDMDGTLLNDDKAISDSIIDALYKAKKIGYVLVLATGRPFVDVHRFVKYYALFDYYICNNGAYYFDTDESNFVYNEFVSQEIIKKIIELGVKDESFLSISTDEGIFRAKLFDSEPIWVNPDLEEFQKFHYQFVPLAMIDGIISTHKIYQISLRSTKKRINWLFNTQVDKLKELADIKVSGEVYLDVNHKNVSKFNAIKTIMEKEKMDDLKNVYVFGDSNNDISMLEGFYHSYCVSNGTIEAKRAAGEVIGSNNSEAIANRVLEIVGD